MFKFLINSAVQLWGGVKSLASSTNRSAIGLYLEFFYCYFRYGCFPRQFLIGEFWNKTANDRKDILTYRGISKVMKKLNKPEDIHLLENKADFNEYFSDYVHRDWIFSKQSTPSQIAEFIKRHGKVIIKPFDEMEGHGIYMLDTAKTGNLDEVSRELASQSVMIEEILRQHPGMKFGNTSVNTIRVHTILDKNGKGHILSCVLRAGVGDSIVDNYCSGGVIYPVDKELGIVDGRGISRVGNGNVIHPGTDIVMLGYQIPNWQTLKSEIVKAAERLPGLRFVGWDVVITSEGIALIEGNHNPDYELYEFIGKGKSYKEIKKFLN